ncbi:cell division protein FtsA [Proteiniborus sp. MB09-C3]|uniref:cell division protein FtsA n=1 Tax=Proteiniborus sp. MB09-C3 TaxID=3050072 RepID=UPI002554B50B|nr:cell division protein FtsA [Proteiniborus sp. MB09-C3]WIV13869.1 cell division protein FtsA [Proteiniborus sp. MB09-C3]
MDVININEMIFSLDIGTRTVIGVVGELHDNNFKILASEIIEHEKRNMYDGQIHDVNSVVNIVKKVKEKLEQKLNIKLDKVAIAAAGRALKTYRTKLEREVDSSTEIDSRLVESLEMESIQSAQNSLDEKTKDEDTRYYCVGYTVINYYLDGNFMENLEGHRGNRIGADVLATFLPYTVVDSLYTVMDRVGLEVTSLTLEPIAAMNIAVKKSLRLLNIALVDIGAGTSDIAISRDGTIVAYAMASVAGDEITESIAKTFLLDFDAAEKLKIELASKELHKFVDILGLEHEIGTDEILDRIDSTIKIIAKEIAARILEFNDKAPSAIFLIGGGSQLPRLNEYIAENLGLQKERVVIRNTSIIENITNIPEQLNGPDAITPIGIGFYALENAHRDFIEVKVNDQKIKLFNTKTIKVSDALTFIGFNPRKLIPKKGEDITYYINGEEKKALGQSGEAAKIYVNDQLASLERKLKNGDSVRVIEATQGTKAEIKLFDCIDIYKKIIVNNKLLNLILDVKVNQKTVFDNIRINDRDIIEAKEISYVEELYGQLNMDKDVHLAYKAGELLNNDYVLKNNDVIEIKPLEESKEIKLKQENNNTLKLIINGEETEIHHSKTSFIFVDIFNYIEIDLSKPQGELILNVNGTKAEFTQELKENDRVEVYWKN